MPKTNILGSILLNAGVPKSVMQFTESYQLQLNTAPYTKNGKSEQLVAKKQEEFLSNVYNILVNNPRTVLLYSGSNNQCARAVALRIFVQFIQSTTLPVWHMVSSDFGVKSDELLVKHKTNPDIPLVVLDNLNVFMSNNQCEKVSRIVATLSCPILLIISGKKPYSYCVDRLGFHPGFILRAEMSKNNVDSNKSERI